MAISTQIQNLNLIPGKSAPVVVHLSQGNVGNTVQFYLYDGDNPYYPTNVSIAVHGVRADNTVFGPYTVSVTSGSNLVSFTIVSAMTSVNGAAIGELVLTDSSQNQIGSANFGMLVEETPYSSSVTYEDDLSIYQRILAYVQSIPASISGQIAAEAATRSEAVSNLQQKIDEEGIVRREADDTLRSSINSETAAREALNTTLSARMDGFTNLPSGSTSGDAELIDIRTGADGTTYSSAGTAVRTQITTRTNAAKMVSPNNWFNPDTATKNVSYNTSTGAESSINGWYLSDYIEVPDTAKGVTALNYVVINGTTYRLSDLWIAMYDIGKGYIGHKTSSSSVAYGLEHVDLPGLCKYIRVTVHWSTLYDMRVIFDNADDLTTGYNFFPYVKRYDKQGVIGNDGAVIAHASFGYTDFIAVPEWANRLVTYNVVTLNEGTSYSLGEYQFATYDSNKTFIENVHGNFHQGMVITPIDSNTVKYIRINYGVNNISDCVAIFLYVPVSTDDKWNGKTGDFLGDSITEQNYYTSALSSLFDITVNNYGVSGTTISNAQASNTFSSRVKNMSDSCDFVFMLGGTNDWGLNATLGTPQDRTENTFYGGLYMTLNALRTKFPTKPIFVSTILQRNWTQTTDQPSGIDSNGKNNSVMQFNEAIIYMAHRFGCIVIDGFGESGICVSNISTYTKDGLHLNNAGGTRYATFIKDAMESTSLY